MTELPNQPQPPRQDDGPEWPTHCEHCGTALQSGVLDIVPDADSEHLQTASPATVIAQDFCPNPSCPARETGTAPGAGAAL